MTQRRPFKPRRASILIAGLVASCGLLFLSKNIGARYDLWQHHRVWTQQQIASYRYTLSVSSMGSPDLNEYVRIEAHDTRPTVVIAVDSRDPFVSPQDAIVLGWNQY